ncbi:bifunctional riboflavin kinase/FAD synthetase [Halioxenophilus aromaticivorans]|uniref:bifunctional riboflavin kinase/FAD synthetase n=1 Tax=Halioxenophilus aromaticivorans TaxID=1306992 RepID=UPI0031E85D2B
MVSPNQQELIYGLHNIKARHHGCVLTVGSFDGVHLGHQQVLQQVQAQAAALNLPSVAMIFEPQPLEFLVPDKAPARLMRFREKIQALFAAGIDRVCCLRFNHTLASLTADEFVEQVLVHKLGVRHLVVGDDFRFGSDRQGDFELLLAHGGASGFEVCSTDTFTINGERVSSTRIRQCLADGDFTLASQLLGKPYTITGHVEYGKQLGRQLGLPTANVKLHRFRSPLQGVYAVRASLPNYPNLVGAANIGLRPTVNGNDKVVLEVHLLDFNDTIYGQLLTVEFCHKLRSEKKFASLDELKQQIQMDVQSTRDYFQGIV